MLSSGRCPPFFTLSDMFCIAAFLVFGILAIFSATYRPLAKQAWHCVLRRVSFRPCDINFSDEVRGRLIGKLVFRHPRVAKFLDRWLDWISFAFVALSVWSVLYLAVAGLNLWVYGTCNPGNVESCSLSGEACGVDQASLSLGDAVKEGKIGTWAAGPFSRFAETLSRIPDRLKTWDPTAYVAPTGTTYIPLDPTKPTVLEVLDPSCRFCRKLFANMKEAGYETAANLTYLLYPIPNPKAESGYKFWSSPILASYVEAAKRVPLRANPSGVAPDWQLLERIFGERDDGTDWQTVFTMGLTEKELRETLRSFLTEIGYSTADVRRIESLAASSEIRDSLAVQKGIVEDQLRTIKIPTLLVGGRRYDRVVGVGTLVRAIRP